MSNKLAEEAKLAYIKKELNHLIEVPHVSDIEELHFSLNSQEIGLRVDLLNISQQQGHSLFCTAAI